MLHILRRSTAIAAIAALPLSGVAIAQSAGDQTQGADQTQSEATSQTQTQGTSQGQAQSQDSQSGAATDSAATDSDTTDSAGSTAQTGDSAQDPNPNAQNVGVADQQEAVEQTGTTAGQSAGQQAQGQGGTSPAEVTQGQDTSPGVVPGSAPAQQQALTAEDTLIATVGDAEIRRSDVLDAISQLPPQLQQQPAQMLIPLAVDQLVTRELILQEARKTGLEDDPEVTALAPDNATETARENALVQVWLDRQLKERVTDAKVHEAYDAVKAQHGDQAPALEDVRPQIESELRQQAFAEISSNLQADAEITVYGPDGQPITE